jgi:hypothetical protein
MSKLQAAILVCAIGFCSSGLAQAASSDQRGVCKQDYDKFCAGMAPGTGHIIPCLNKHHDQLSASCKKALDSHKKR